ncbi:MAG: hypothetical protein KF819_15080 [Labilithrix sp.]|nr:hypothetical protein [Labilithrix sp.]
MSNLRSTIDRLAAQFAGNIIEALRGASIEELYEVAGGGARGARGRARASEVVLARKPRARGGRLGRRSATEIGGMVDAIVGALQKSEGGLRAEQIREQLGVEAKELPRPLAEALSQGRITKTGQKRATTYFVGSGAAAGGAKKRGRKAGARKKR